MQKICKYMLLFHEFTSTAYTCQNMQKNMHKYAKYESMKIKCIICTSHFTNVIALNS